MRFVFNQKVFPLTHRSRFYCISAAVFILQGAFSPLVACSPVFLFLRVTENVYFCSHDRSAVADRIDLVNK